MELRENLEHQWPYLLSFLPAEEILEGTAKTWGAIRRRRAIDSASTLLRLALVYGFCGFSLRQAAAWAEAAQVASLSDVALLKRLRNASDWLGHILGIKLAERVLPVPPMQSRVRLIDATTISAPASKGTNWRLHLDFDLGALAISEIQLTQADGGESLLRYEFEPGELAVADRGYANRPGLAHVVEAGAHFIVRLNWATVPLQKPGGDPFDLLAAVRSLPEAKAGSFDLEIQPKTRDKIPAVPVRLIALRKSEEASERARKTVLQQASKRGKAVQPKTLELASYVLVLTSTSGTDISPEQALEIYRFRWQIELVFKRLKGLLHLDTLPAKDPQLAQTFLISKLLAAFLLEEITTDYISVSPWGFRIRTPTATLPVENPQSAPLQPALRGAGPRSDFHLDR